MRLTRADLKKIDLEPFRPCVTDSAAFFAEKNEHYQLLAHLSTLVPKGAPIIDIGTHQGDSALALSYSGAYVESFDVVDKIGSRAFPPNIRFHRADLFDLTERSKWAKKLLESALILIDVDPHEGTREYELVRWLQEYGYRGIIVLDDIWYFKPMRDNLWYRIEPGYKTDVTAFGHWSGTGIVSFGDQVRHEDEKDTSNWTLVTGYFDLTGKDDASPEIKARPAEHYIDRHGSSVLSLNQNLVVFCDPATEPKVWAKRPKRLHGKTCVIVREFEDFPLSKYREKIIENRGGPWCSRDPRNTASYYLFCMARYAMLKHAIRFNAFNSTHFAWINICIERMGFNNLVHLDEALGQNRDKFSTCFIDYVSKTTVEDLPKYFGTGGCKNCAAGCTMCSGFFTGNAQYMREVCDRIEYAFLHCVERGYGHADEQLFPMVYHAHPDLFEWYVGDYAEMITNYAHVYKRPEQPIKNLIQNSLAAGDHAVCRRACEIVWNSFVDGKCSLDKYQRAALLNLWSRT